MTEPVRACAIGVMTKTPTPGVSKTRLCPPLEPEQAASLSAAFLLDTTRNIAEAARLGPVQAYAAYAPAGTEDRLRRHLAPDTGCLLADGSRPMPRGVDGFGRCLLHAIGSMLARGHRAACVLSSDTPTLPTGCLLQAADLLVGPGAPADGRVVLGACGDGGYYLLGMTRPHPSLFTDIAWSTGSVAAATRLRAREAGLEMMELEQWYDVDDAAGLLRLSRDQAGYAAPATRLALARLDVGALAAAASP